MNVRPALLALMVVCGGCGTVQLYDGPRLSASEVARISGDPSISAGLPVTAVLREVDDVALKVSQTTVEVLPGKHQLLVDCRIADADTKSTTRHSIDAEVSAGRHYKLVAEAGPGLRECTQVTLQTVDF
jgi:hypothetical protein